GVLDQHRRDRRTAIERVLVPHQHRADARMVEIADRRIAQAGALDQTLVQPEDAGIGVERAAALILPAAGDGRDRRRRMHVDRAVALAGKTVAEPEKGLFRGAYETRETLDLGDRQTGDGGSPLRRAVLEVRFQ